MTQIEKTQIEKKKAGIEDERIREWLIEEIKATHDFDSPTSKKCVDDALAYLERQKDERELGFIEGKVEGVRQTSQEIKDAMSLFEPKDLTPFEFTFRDYVDSAIRYCLSGEGYQQYIKEWAADLLNLERQKEQKPVEWSEGDDNALVYFHELISFGYIKNFCDAQTAEDMRRWLHERLKSRCSQPKAHDLKIKGWVERDIGGQVILTVPHGPGVADEYILLENNMFPDLRPDNTRIEVDVIIRKK